MAKKQTAAKKIARVSIMLCKEDDIINFDQVRQLGFKNIDVFRQGIQVLLKQNGKK